MLCHPGLGAPRFAPGPPIHRAAVVIEGDRIVAVGPASEVEIPAGNVFATCLVILHASVS